MIQHSVFICPGCRRLSAEMELSQEQYEPTEADLKKRPWTLGFSNEVLICPCGLKHTWFTLHEFRHGKV